VVATSGPDVIGFKFSVSDIILSGSVGPSTSSAGGVASCSKDSASAVSSAGGEGAIGAATSGSGAAGARSWAEVQVVRLFLALPV